MHKSMFRFPCCLAGRPLYSNGGGQSVYPDCIRSGMKVYKTPMTIGREEERKSTGFPDIMRNFFL